MSLSRSEELATTKTRSDEQIRELPWVNDGLSPHEFAVAQGLLDMALDNPLLFREFIFNPFLSTFDGNEEQVIKLVTGLPPVAMSRLHESRGGRDGINDSEAQEIVADGNFISLGLLTDLHDRRLYLLRSINIDRKGANVGLLTLGDNEAAQSHAGELRNHNYLSHWNLEGYTSYMRSTMAGEEDYAMENASNTILNPAGNYGRLTDIAAELDKIQGGFMRSAGHRKNTLDPAHKKVSLGITCDDYACAVVQLFEGDYVEFSEKPNIGSGGMLSFSGRFKDGYRFSDSSSVQIWWEPLPMAATLGQLDKTGSQSIGVKPATFILDPPPAGSYYPSLTTIYSWTKHRGPADFAADSPRTRIPPLSAFVPQMPRIGLPSPPSIAQVQYTVASRWEGRANGQLSLEVDISDTLRKLGDGVYTVLVWGSKDGENELLVVYSIFYNR